ncbi:MAG TPA: BamA/TamA family outer membrane protein [Candidatus Sulfopaludibacter sp.]|jgi:hypothetical protein|nr:BamA/TamA family outer membrane protein [Candidatus Sulfopaludibacter sp.]
MKYAWLGCLLFGGLLFGGTQDSDINVNTRYTVDAVTIFGKGWKTTFLENRTDQAQQTQKLSNRLKTDLVDLIGRKLNPAVLDTLAQHIKKELSARQVAHRLLRGDTQDHVRVEFEVTPARGGVDLDATQFTYNSRLGWSGAGEAGFNLQQRYFLFGLVSDGESQTDRYAGFNVRYEDRHLGSDRLALRFQFESYHDMWNASTLDALKVDSRLTSDAYRSRENFQPTLSIAIAKPLSLEVGASFERFDSQLPGLPTEAANAVFTTIRYHRQAESADNQQEVDANYGMRLAAKTFASDFSYARHSVRLRYHLQHGKHSFSDEFWGGLVAGRAPLDDRFVLGNSTYLRGWNKYELDPIGGNRVVYNSVDYRYGPFQAFYDTGAVWDEGQATTARHSVGVGLRASILSLAVAFPIRGGHIEPVFMMGLLY